MTNSSEYTSLVSLEHRKKFGQYYTPINIAKFMLSWILENDSNSIHDPAFGMGVFYDAVKELGFSKNFSATEIDKTSYDFYKSYNSISFLENKDYFTVLKNKYDGIICNPPYLKFHDFKERKKIITELNNRLKLNLSGYTNISSAFLVKSIDELKEGGRLAYIMPLEFLSSEYGKAIKKFLIDNGNIIEIIKIVDEGKVFSSVTTTICILLYEKSNHHNFIKFSIMSNVENISVENISRVPIKNLNHNEKWLPYFEAYTPDSKINLDKFVNLTEYGKFKRGIATGANDFFSINIEKIDKLGINRNEYSFCITKSNQITKSIFKESDLSDLVQKGKSVMLFDIKNIDKISSYALKYIKKGEEQEYHKRYLTRSRKIWFQLEDRDVSPILFGVFSRGGFKIIRNYSCAKNLTCYHGFVPNNNKYIDRVFLFFKSDLGNELLRVNGRKYGRGLDKLEPSDLNNTPILSPEHLDLINDKMLESELKNLERYNKVSSAFNQFIYSLAC